MRRVGSAVLSILGIVVFAAFFFAFSAGMGMVCEWAGTTPVPIRWAVSYVANCGFPSFVTTRDTRRDQQHETAASHASAAITWQNKAAEIVSRTFRQGLNAATVSSEDREKVLDYKEKSLAEAELTDTEELNRLYPGWGDHFRDEFVPGQQAVVAFLRGQASPATGLTGMNLTNQFADWYTENLNGIRGN
jgi:hypothetical protein